MEASWLCNSATYLTDVIQFDEAIGYYQGETLYHARLDTTEYETRLQRQGFAVTAHIVENATCDRTVQLAKLVQRYHLTF